jgi:hypothetical protein
MLREMIEECMGQLAACLPADMRGAYPQADAAEPQWLDFSL